MLAAQDPSIEQRVALMLALVKGVDLASADGRAGLGRFLAEVERLAPGSIRQAAARQDAIALRLKW